MNLRRSRKGFFFAEIATLANGKARGGTNSSPPRGSFVITPARVFSLCAGTQERTAKGGTPDAGQTAAAEVISRSNRRRCTTRRRLLTFPARQKSPVAGVFVLSAFLGVFAVLLVARSFGPASGPVVVRFCWSVRGFLSVVVVRCASRSAAARLLWRFRAAGRVVLAAGGCGSAPFFSLRWLAARCSFVSVSGCRGFWVPPFPGFPGGFFPWWACRRRRFLARLAVAG